jgi:hypothetical protein
MITEWRQQELREAVEQAGRGKTIPYDTKEECDFIVSHRAHCLKPQRGNERHTSDGSSADYYILPKKARQLQDLISFRDMNSQLGEIFRATYRYGMCSHSPKKREIKKILFYAQAELDRLNKYEERESNAPE